MALHFKFILTGLKHTSASTAQKLCSVSKPDWCFKGKRSQATMASSILVYTLCMLLACICSQQTVVMANVCFLSLSHYRHEIRGGPNNTVLLAAGTMPFGWGSFIVYDNMMKEGESADSKLLGKITGSSVVTTKGGVALNGVQTLGQHIFGEASKYNGSSLTIIGSAALPNPPWELIVPGGTGYFKGYSGYVLANPIPSATVGPLVVSKWDFCLSKF